MGRGSSHGSDTDNGMMPFPNPYLPEWGREVAEESKPKFAYTVWDVAVAVFVGGAMVGVAIVYVSAVLGFAVRVWHAAAGR